MKPLPKWITWLSLVVGLLIPGGALAGVVPAKIAAIASAFAGILGALGHSVTGTGGTVQNP